MRWIRYRDSEGAVRLGVESDRGLQSLPLDAVRTLPAALGAAVQSGDLIAWIEAGGSGYDAALFAQAVAWPTLAPEQFRVLAPIVRPPKNIFCIGRNYRSHAAEAARFRGQPESIPQHPMIFTKPYTAIQHPGDPIWYEAHITEQLDYEGELAVIIGRAGRDIAEADAFNYVYGYTLLNDVTARDLQAQHQQYFKGKSLDTYAPMGPAVVPQSGIKDVGRLQIRTTVNGELRQEAEVEQLIFSIPRLIAVLSQGMTLEPGDVISTGTPAGVGAGFQPPRYLRPGDWVEVSIAEIGVLRNPVVQRES